MTRTRQITIERHSVTLIRTNGANRSVYCEHCGEAAATFAPEQIAELLQLDLTEICRRVETKQIHLANSERGLALICGSLFQNSSLLKELQSKTKG